MQLQRLSMQHQPSGNVAKVSDRKPDVIQIVSRTNNSDNHDLSCVDGDVLITYDISLAVIVENADSDISIMADSQIFFLFSASSKR